ncbi:hypothetical protein Nocox_36160 [Nonomuraea coxensis DSM 45129]|uniref:DUF222 domain-containing protein n=1 Tax=Nonomuraea coxensis DSM 45129 TaxID=1122611 RepID=A0ABX8UDM3_9ACTN|nr:hypothetical protein [Nonomuraea coxensis]QYC44788.1 hypothetical protein Nocox_36160 [Nonomuraea coxensis DSM 45129]
MTRSEFDDIRAFLADEGTSAGDRLGVAMTLIDDLEYAHTREAVQRSRYLQVLTAARASAAAELAGEPDPLSFVRDELARRGELPQDDEEVRRILDDARTAGALRAYMEGGVDPVQPSPRGPRLRRCAGARRTLRS